MEPVRIEFLMVDKLGAGLDRVQDKAGLLRAEAARAGEEVRGLGGALRGLAGRLALGFGVKELAGKIAAVRGEFQQLEAAFRTMLGSADKADALMSQLVKTAATTPFGLQDVANGAKQLLAYGLEAEKVNGTLIRLGDIAAGLSIPLGDLVYLYGTTMAQGRLYMQDLNQFAGRGIPIIEELAGQFKVAESEVRGLVEAGEVGFPEIQKMIEHLTDAGGKFGGLMEAQSRTITGQIRNIEDAIEMMFNDIGKSGEGAINTALSGASYLVENYEKVGRMLLELVGTYGTYKLALMGLSAVENLRYQMTLAHMAGLTKMQAVMTVLREKTAALNRTMLANPYALAAAAIAGLAYGIYRLVTADTAAEKAQKQFNNELEEAAKRKEELTSRTDSLISKINDETETVYAQIKAYKELIKLFPELGNLTFEEFKGMPQNQQQRMLSGIMDKRDLDNAVKAYEDDLKRIGTLEKIIDMVSASSIQTGPSITSGVNPLVLTSAIKELEKAKELARLHKEEIEKTKELQWEANTPVEEKVKHYEDIRDSLIAERDELEKTLAASKGFESAWMVIPDLIGDIRLDDLNRRIGETTDKINSLTGTVNVPVEKNKSYWEKQEKEARSALESIESTQKRMMDAGNFKGIDKSVAGIYKKSVKKLKEAEKELATYDDYSKLEKADKRKENRQKIADELLSLRRKNQQDEIGLMEEGAGKRLAQINLDYENETADILAKEKEWKEAQGGRLTQEQTAWARSARPSAARFSANAPASPRPRRHDCLPAPVVRQRGASGYPFHPVSPLSPAKIGENRKPAANFPPNLEVMLPCFGRIRRTGKPNPCVANSFPGRNKPDSCVTNRTQGLSAAGFMRGRENSRVEYC